MKELIKLRKEIRKNERKLHIIAKRNENLRRKFYALEREEENEAAIHMIRTGKILKKCIHGKLKNWKCNEEKRCRGHLMCKECGEKRILFAYNYPMTHAEFNQMDQVTRKIHRKYILYRATNRDGLIPTRPRF